MTHDITSHLLLLLLLSLFREMQEHVRNWGSVVTRLDVHMTNDICRKPMSAAAAAATTAAAAAAAAAAVCLVGRCRSIFATAAQW
jgi:hypothetical protein